MNVIEWQLIQIELDAFYLNKLPPDQPLGETAVVVLFLLLYFILTCSL